MFTTIQYKGFRYMLTLFFFFITILSSEAYSASTTAITIEENRETKAEPIKPRAKSAKKIGKKRPKHNTNKFLDYSILPLWILCIAGITLFSVGIPLAIFGLWLSGLLLFGIGNLLMIFIAGSSMKGDDTDNAISVILIGFYFNAGLGLIWIIIGLIASFPVMWILGAATILLSIVYALLIRYSE